MFDETTAASIVSALRRWTNSPASRADDTPDATGAGRVSLVATGLAWSESLGGLMEGAAVELNERLPNLTDALEGARVVFEPATEGAAEIRPNLDVQQLSREARTDLGPDSDLSTPITALRPDAPSVQTIFKLSSRSILDGCTVPVRSWRANELFGFLHVEWSRRPRVHPDEMRWRLLAIAQMIAESCAAERSDSRQSNLMSYLIDELRSSREVCLLVEADRVVFANDAAVQFWGGSAESLHARKYPEILKPISSTRKRSATPQDHPELLRVFCLADGRERLVEVTERTVSTDRALRRVVRIVEPEADMSARHRALIESLSEAVWQVETRTPIQVADLTPHSLRSALNRASLIECNRRMIDLIADVAPASGDVPEVGDVLAFLGDELLREFINEGLQLRNREHRVRGRDGRMRHFVVSLQGVSREGRMTHLLGSTLETTAYAEVEQQTVSALEKQREDLGRELHDVVGQLLTGIRLLSSNLARDTSLPPEKVRLHATRVSQMAEEAHLNLRQINRGLSATHLQHVRLDDALHDLAEFVGSMPTLDCTFDCEEAIDEIEPEKKLQIYRIAQEAINNALKHADATRIVLQWRRAEGGMMLAVRDNGKGFLEENLDKKTLGLHSMRYRARVVGADLEISTIPGDGTTVQCIVPF